MSDESDTYTSSSSDSWETSTDSSDELNLPSDPYPFKFLPDLMGRFHLPQCVFLPKHQELLICGGHNNELCFSYHIQKQEYKYICNNLSSLNGHIVVIYPSQYSPFSYNNNNNKNDNNNNNDDNTVILLCFGGNGSYGCPYHTGMMKYQSVWTTNYPTIMKKKREHSHQYTITDHRVPANKWAYLPGSTTFRKYKGHTLQGARALIGGSQQHLLFITHAPKNIDVINCETLEYLKNIKNNILPVSEDNKVNYHCFLPKNINKKNRNEFILMSNGETLFIRYHENNNEFSYQLLSFHSPFKNCSRYAYAIWNHRIFIFGGKNFEQNKKMDSIWKIEIKEKSCSWKKCNFKMPFAMCGAAAVVNENDSSIHIVGGQTHLIMHLQLKKYDIEIIIKRWIREIKLKMGWIVEFYDIIENYINP